MISALTKSLKKLQALSFARAHANLWVIKRGMRAGVAKYDALAVRTEAALQRKLSDIVSSAVRSANHVEPYEFLSEELDTGEAVGLRMPETDLQAIYDQIAEGSAAPSVTSADQLYDSWAYAIAMEAQSERILAVHKIPEGWKLKQKGRTLNAVFRDHILMDVAEDQIFKLEKKIDFFAYDGLVFVLDKKKFEAAMNFRAGMERSRDDLLRELHSSGLIDDVEVIRSATGVRLNFLRRMAMIKKNGYYKQPDFMANLKLVCTAQGWPVTFDGDKIITTEENVELILKLLNNDRLESMLTDEIFDVSAKKKVGT
ncbi:MAG TPA: Kiwa anti-phage protein KwaB-like domain-containing protein [Planctomycetota bacterium]|jgi:hypothetical protein